jgi:hypothetical protein
VTESGRLARSLGLALVASPLVLDTLEDLANRRSRESARGEKTCLLRTFGLGFWEPAVFLAPNGLGTRQFGLAQLGARLFDQRLGDRVALQLPDNPVGAKPRRAAVDQALSEALIGQPALAFKRIEQSF